MGLRISEKGFTLLEVMIAMAILAMVFVTAFWSQSKTVDMKNYARWNMTTALLVQRLLSSISGHSMEDLNSEFLDIANEYPNLSFRVEGGVEPFSDLKGLKEFQLEIEGPSEGFNYKAKILLFHGAQ